MNKYLSKIATLFVSIILLGCSPYETNVDSIDNNIIKKNNFSESFMAILEEFIEKKIDETDLSKRISLSDIQKFYLFSISYNTKILKHKKINHFEKKFFNLSAEEFKEFQKKWYIALLLFFDKNLSDSKKKEYLESSHIFFTSDELKKIENDFLEAYYPIKKNDQSLSLAYIQKELINPEDNVITKAILFGFLAKAYDYRSFKNIIDEMMENNQEKNN